MSCVTCLVSHFPCLICHVMCHLIFSFFTRATPHEKSWGESPPSKSDFFCFNMKDNKSTGHEITFLSSLYFFFGTFSAILGLDQKLHLLWKIEFKILLSGLQKPNLVFQTIYIQFLHMTQI